MLLQGSSTPAPAAQPAEQSANCVNAQASYLAAVAARDEMRSQVAQLNSQRTSIAQRLRGGGVSGADQAGLEARMTALDKQIVAGYDAIARADAAVITAVAVPCAVPPEPPRPPQNGPDDAEVAMGIVFFVVVLMPLSIALARRIWKRTPAVAQPSRELMERLSRIEESVESVAIEVERIGEGQRFVTNLLVENPTPQMVNETAPQRAMLGAGAAEPVPLRARESVGEQR